MSELGLADKVVALHAAFDATAIAHAFGGALALAYYAEPRATVDIDMNLFVDPAEYPRILDILEPMSLTKAPAASTVTRDGQCRVWWGRSPIDLFFAYDRVHTAMRDWVRTVPFGDTSIPILAPEHLIVVKVVFNRAKDWLDLEQVLVATPRLDFGEIERWLQHLISTADKRATRFDVLRRRLFD